MRTWLPTLAALASLGDLAAADDVQPAVLDVNTTGLELGSRRGVAQEYLVLPSGGELTGQMRFMTAEPVFSDEPVRFSDLAMFELAGRWSLLPRLEVSAQVDLLAKQPSYTDEKPWQSVSGGLRTPLGARAALAINGAGGHLIDHAGMWLQQSLAVQWKKPIARVFTFHLSGGVDAVELRAPGRSSAVLGEAAIGAQTQFHIEGMWGGWVGLGYAIPVVSRGDDPTTGLALDPQPRLDLRIGTVMSLVKEWDLFVEYAHVDRGDLVDPATRLPILNGGFDQQQLVLGVTRHLEGARRSERDAMIVGSR